MKLRDDTLIFEAYINGTLTPLKIKPEEVDPEELRMGIEVEHEHTNDPKIAEKIALDHLAENPRYYSQLKKSKIDPALN